MVRNEEIKWGKKMIKISVYFWTDDLPKDANEKTAWAKGVIYIVANKFRGLKPGNVPFNRMEEFFPKLGELLKKNNIKLKY